MTAVRSSARALLCAVLASCVLLALASCGPSGGGGGASEPETYSVFIRSTQSEVATSSIDLYGSATCDACPPSETAIGGCPVIRGPFPSAIDVRWSNQTSGQSGSANHAISGQCGCLLSYCTVTYSHRWTATVPLAIGVNEVEIEATGPTMQPGGEKIEITRVPAAPTGLVVEAEHGAITLRWDSVLDAAQYDLLWSTSPELDPLHTQRVADVTSPFRHEGLTDDTPYYYAVIAMSGIYESARSDVVWATAGWSAEDLPVATATWTPWAISLALDRFDQAHVHLSRVEGVVPSWVTHNEYVTNQGGTWTSTPVAGLEGSFSFGDASIAVDARDTAHLGFIGGAGMIHATVASGVWTSETVDPSAFCRSHLALDDLDHVHAAYRAGSELRTATDASGVWVARRLDASNPSCGSTDLAPSIAVDASGDEHVAYVGASPEHDLLYATNDGVGWSTSTIAATQPRGFSLALDPQGVPHVVYSDAGAIVHHARLESTGEWTSETIDTGQGVGPSIAISDDGSVHLSYVTAAGGLRHATNATGSWRILPVDDADYASGIAGTSIALDSQDRVHIAVFGTNGPRYVTNR